MRTRTLPVLPVLLVAGLLVLALQPRAGAATTDASDSVRVMLVSIDALDPAELDELDDGGNPIAPTLVSLREQGTWWTEARGVMASETLPNHVAMATGTYPGTNSIPGNDGRLQPGDDTLADPDLGVPEAREATSLMAAIEEQCPDLRTVTSLSKEYVWRTFQGEGDASSTSPSSTSRVGPRARVGDRALHPPAGERGADRLPLRQPRRPRPGRPHRRHRCRAVPPMRSGRREGGAACRPGPGRHVDPGAGPAAAGHRRVGPHGAGLISDHSMNFTISGDERWNIDVGAALQQVEDDNGRDPGSTFLFSPNGGASFVYLVDPDDPTARRCWPRPMTRSQRWTGSRTRCTASPTGPTSTVGSCRRPPRLEPAPDPPGRTSWCWPRSTTAWARSRQPAARQPRPHLDPPHHRAGHRWVGRHRHRTGHRGVRPECRRRGRRHCGAAGAGRAGRLGADRRLAAGPRRTRARLPAGHAQLQGRVLEEPSTRRPGTLLRRGETTSSTPSGGATADGGTSGAVSMTRPAATSPPPVRAPPLAGVLALGPHSPSGVVEPGDQRP